jgi:hypothetical protein
VAIHVEIAGGYKARALLQAVCDAGCANAACSAGDDDGFVG